MTTGSRVVENAHSWSGYICWSVGAGLAVVDTLRGAEYQSRNLLMVLNLGEPTRVSRALSVESGFVAAQGDAIRARRLHGRALETAQQVNQSELIGLAKITGGIVEYFGRNDWAASLAMLSEGEEIMRAHQNAGWELDNAQLFTALNLMYMGELGELSRRVPTYVQEARRRGDRYLAVTLHCRGHWIKLAEGDGEAAGEILRASLEEWSHAARGFQVQHWWNLLSRCDVALFQQRPGAEGARAAPKRRSPFVVVDASACARRVRFRSGPSCGG